MGVRGFSEIGIVIDLGRLMSDFNLLLHGVKCSVEVN